MIVEYHIKKARGQSSWPRAPKGGGQAILLPVRLYHHKK